MTDFSIEIRVRNARIRRRIREAGYKNVNQFCVQNGLSPVDVGEVINFRETPYTKQGKWRTCVLRMAEALDCLPDDLFSETQKTMRVGSNVVEKELVESEVLRLVAAASDRAAPALDEVVGHEYSSRIIKDALSSLNDRQRKVLERRFGLDGDGEHTLIEVGAELGVSPPRIRQIEAQALHKLRNFKRGCLAIEQGGEP